MLVTTLFTSYWQRFFSLSFFTVKTFTVKTFTIRTLTIRTLAPAIFGLFFYIGAISHGHAIQAVMIDAEMPATSIGEFVEYYEDKSQKLTYDDVLAPEHNNRFTLSRQNHLRFGYTESTYWVRFNLKNNTSKEKKVILNIKRPNIGRIHLYSEDQEPPLQTAGAQTEQFYGDIRHYTYLFYLDLGANEERTFYISLSSVQYLNFSMIVSSPEQFLQSLNIDQLLFGLSFGIIFGLFVYHLFVYKSVKDSSYLYYILLLISLFGFLGTQSGYFSFIWRFPAGLQNHLEIGFVMLVIPMAALFARSYLKMPESAFWLDRILQIIAYSSLIICAVLPFIPPHISAQASTLLAICISPALVAAGAISWRNGYPPARYYLISRATYMLALILSVQTAYGYLPAQIQITHVILFAGVLEAILLALGLGERVSFIKSEDQNRHQRVAVAEAERRTKTEFLAKMSHEIRTPMNGILGMAELLEGTALTTNQDDFVRTIHESGNNLLKILDDILDYSRIETGRIELAAEPFDLSLILTETLNDLRYHAEEKKLNLTNDLATDIPANVRGDPVRLQQIISSLVSTVIKYSEHGEVIIKTSYANKDRNLIQFKIKSTSKGSGIPKELVDQLVLNKHKTGNDIAAEFGHTGIGLIIAKQLIALMEGNINAKLIPGKGGSIWVTIPLQALPKTAINQQSYETNLADLKLLIVDDNASCRMVIEQQASGWGMRVTSAINGKHALAILRTQANLREPFDIVILDHDMPGMNGLELAAKVREDGLITHDILIIMMTGLGVSPNTTAARDAGIRRVLTKPVSGKLLKITLAEELDYMLKALGSSQIGNHSIQKFHQQARVLVAEDHRISQKVIKGMLAKLGVDVDTVDNGEKAITAMKTGKYDLVLMDYDMPVKNGFEATIDIRRWEKENGFKETPIIALTAHIMDEHKEQSFQCGMNAHLTKPVELFELQNTLVRWTRVELPTSESPTYP